MVDGVCIPGGHCGGEDGKMKYNHEGCPRHQKHNVNDQDKAFRKQTTSGSMSASWIPQVTSSSSESSESFEPKIIDHNPEQSHPDETKTVVDIIRTIHFSIWVIHFFQGLEFNFRSLPRRVQSQIPDEPCPSV